MCAASFASSQGDRTKARVPKTEGWAWPWDVLAVFAYGLVSYRVLLMFAYAVGFPSVFLYVPKSQTSEPQRRFWRPCLFMLCCCDVRSVVERHGTWSFKEVLILFIPAAAELYLMRAAFQPCRHRAHRVLEPIGGAVQRYQSRGWNVINAAFGFGFASVFVATLPSITFTVRAWCRWRCILCASRILTSNSVHPVPPLSTSSVLRGSVDPIW